jgi:23S rRNA (adenine2503-C2)-methyltransferase
MRRLAHIKRTAYGPRFQLQISIHSTDPVQRRRLIPAPVWGFGEIAAYGREFVTPGDRKITLNFALSADTVFEPDAIESCFDPALFLIKVTPVNPTYKALESGWSCPWGGMEIPVPPHEEKLRRLEQMGYEVRRSVGEPDENRIGSNCGQYLKAHFSRSEPDQVAYSEV